MTMLQNAPSVPGENRSRWSDSSINTLRELQEKAYSRLGKQLGLGDDPLIVHSKLTAGPIPKERISAEKFHETFDKTFGSSNGSSNPEGAIDNFLQKYWNPKLPTPYEESGWYSILLMDTDAIEDVLKSFDLPVPRHLLFGTLPTGTVNAEAILVPGSRDYVIVFQSGLFDFCHEMAALVAITYPPVPSLDSDFNFNTEPALGLALKEHPEVLDHFKHMIYCYIVQGNPRLSSRLSLDASHYPLAGKLNTAMEVFVLAHEYIHVIYRHVEKKQDIEDIQKDSIRWSWEAEFDADDLGFGITKNALTLASAYLGADYFLACTDLIEQVLFVLNRATKASPAQTDHPPFSERRKRLRDLLRRDLPGNETERLIWLANQQQTVLDRLRDQSMGDWVEMQKKGVRPFAIWG
jgi:hypothetical protein